MSSAAGERRTGRRRDRFETRTRSRRTAMSDRGFTKAGLERLHEVMARHVDDGSHPGLVWMVARPGHVHVGEIGVADARRGPRRCARDTIFRISSMTKPVTATATMMLVEDCRIRLDDPVDAWLPELANRQVLRSARQRGRRHGPREPADHGARPAHVPLRLRDDHGRARVAADPARARRRRHGCGAAAAGQRARRRRAGCAASPTPARAPARRAVDVPHRLRHARRADRPRVGPAVRRLPARARSSNRSA